MTDQDHVEFFSKFQDSYNSLITKTGDELKKLLSAMEEAVSEAQAAGLTVSVNGGFSHPRMENPFYTVDIKVWRTTELL